MTIESAVDAARAYVLYDKGEVQRRVAAEHVWPGLPGEFRPGTRAENLRTAQAYLEVAASLLEERQA